ncbi:MAG TPA: family 78 glycoside hydrolase catalytic domain [Verrucomicrobiae bacterium]|nr:family 78 glycoside hydrolase catalytic domain [Verrucomicrobiae bacterium]
MRCEYQTNPLGIDNPHPRLTWDIVSKRRGEVQTAYEILVSSRKDLLATKEGDLWDSGRVASDQSVDVEYSGKPLLSRATCFWKVRIWDRDGKPSDWSSTSSWTMGLLEPPDWQAQWISDPVLADPANRPLTPIHCYRSHLESRPDAGKWIVLDLGTDRPMDSMDIIPARPKAERGDFRTAMFPLRFKVEAASRPDFSDARLVVDETASDFPNPRNSSSPFTFPTSVTARYVRLAVTRLSYWDGQNYGLALGGIVVYDRGRPISTSARVECSDSIESDVCSKRFLTDGKADVALADDSPVLAAGIPGVQPKGTFSRVPMLCRDFDLHGRVKRATLYVSARGFYEVHINGQRVGDELLAPGFTDYYARLQYQTFDVTGLLRHGPNAIGALLGYGWYAGHMNLARVRCIDGYFPQFLAQLEIELANGQRITITTDDNWRSTLNGPVRWSDLLDGEGYDSRREMPGWDKAGFDDQSWSTVWTQPRNDVPLVSQFCQPVREVGELRPVSVRETKPGIYVYDFGQEITGWCRLKAHAPAGTHVRLRHAEMIDANGNLDVRNLWGTPQEEDYILDGRAQIFRPHFTYHGFRYVELSGLPGRPAADTLVAVNIRSGLSVAGQFECSNALYNRIQKAAYWTQANLLFDVPAGCAARSERLAWTGDVRPCVQSLLFNFDAAAFLTKYARDLRDDQSADGRFTDICPHDILRGSTKCAGSPGWADAGVSLPWNLYVNTGDRQMLAKHFDAARRWVDFIHGANPDLIWRNERGNDWGDWLSAGPPTPKELGATAMFAHSADLVARMAQALGRQADAINYSELFQNIRRAFVKNYIGSDGTMIGDGDTQGSYALALDFGLLDEPLKSRAVARLDQLVKKNKDHPTTGFWSSVELLLALSATGYNGEAARMLNQQDMPSWGYMANHGTTLWEAFNANSRNLSLNHWTHSAVNEWLWRNVAGLNPDEQLPGYESFTIAPRPTSTVSWCRSSYDSIRGPIVIGWKCEGRQFNLEVTIPANSTATVIVPADNPGTVTESGLPAARAEGVRFLSAGPDSAAYHIGSGTYCFTSVYKE